MSKRLGQGYWIALVVVALGFLPRYAHANEVDERIMQTYKNSYVAHNYLHDDKIEATSVNGVVTLVGTVNEDSHKSLANETIASIPGVQRIDNRIVVNKTEGDKPDVWLALKIKTALLYHPSVSALRTHVSVTDGVATLTGEAKSLAEKELATEYAQDIEGIKMVNNNMTIDQDVAKKHDDDRDDKHKNVDEKIDDASIIAQIKVALWSHRSTSMVTTKVESNNGTVTLTGKAKNEAEKDLVTKISRDIRGVTNVDNKMSIN